MLHPAPPLTALISEAVVKKLKGEVLIVSGQSTSEKAIQVRCACRDIELQPCEDAMQYGTVRSTAPLENKNRGYSLYLGLLRGGRGVPCFLGSHRHVCEQLPRPPFRAQWEVPWVFLCKHCAPP
jgi:hypothetical protein